jgi:hypothetical protein
MQRQATSNTRTTDRHGGRSAESSNGSALVHSATLYTRQMLAAHDPTTHNPPGTLITRRVISHADTTLLYVSFVRAYGNAVC